MKKKSAMMLIFILLFFSINSFLIITTNNNNVKAFSGLGDGSSSNPYQITNVSQLQEMANNRSEYFILMNNIDCSETSTWNNGKGFNPVGNSSGSFTGNFDGNGYTISNLYINRPKEDHVGLFGRINTIYDIHNITLDNFTIIGDNRVGSLVGYIISNNGRCDLYDITVINSFINCSHGYLHGHDYIGGVIGRAYDFDRSGHPITNIHTYNVNMSVYLPNSIGGLIGYGERIYHSGYTTGVIKCSTHGNIEITGNGGNWVGGLIGNAYIVNIFECFSNVNINNYRYGQVGGLVGEFRRAFNSKMSDCYSTGDIITTLSSGQTGGFMGTLKDTTAIYNVSNCYSISYVPNGNGFLGEDVTFNEPCHIYNCFWDTNTSTQTKPCSEDGCCIVGHITNKTTSEMKNISTFTDNTTYGLNWSWDFNNIWDIKSGELIKEGKYYNRTSANSGYPFLRNNLPRDYESFSIYINESPSNNSINVQRDSLSLCVEINTSCNDSDFTIDFLNISKSFNDSIDGIYCLNLNDYPYIFLEPNTTYTWYLNFSGCGFEKNFKFYFTTEISECNCLYELNYIIWKLDNLEIEGNGNGNGGNGMIELTFETIMLLLFVFFVVIAEYKEDIIYFWISALIGLPYGVYLYYQSAFIGQYDLSFYLGTAVILASFYLVLLGLLHAYQTRKKKKLSEQNN